MIRALLNRLYRYSTSDSREGLADIGAVMSELTTSRWAYLEDENKQGHYRFDKNSTFSPVVRKFSCRRWFAFNHDAKFCCFLYWKSNEDNRMHQICLPKHKSSSFKHIIRRRTSNLSWFFCIIQPHGSGLVVSFVTCLREYIKTCAIRLQHYVLPYKPVLQNWLSKC